MDDYITGCDVLGACIEEVLGASVLPGLQAEPGGGPYVTIHFTNPEKLVRDKGGDAGATMLKIIPQTILSQVYGQTAQKIADGMKAEGADADVRVVTQRPTGGPFGSDAIFGAVSGAATVGVIYGIVRLIRHFRKGK